MRAPVLSVRTVVAGSTLATVLAVDDLIVEVAAGADFEGEETLLVAGAQVGIDSVAYADVWGSGVTVDTVTLTDPSPVAASVGARVDVYPHRVAYVAEVLVGETPELVEIPHHLINKRALRVSSVPIGTVVRLRADGDGGWEIVNVVGEAPADNAAMLDPTTAMPAGTFAETFSQHGADLAGVIPPLTFGDGSANADIDWKGRNQFGPLKADAGGLGIVLEDGSAPVALTPAGLRIGGVDIDAKHLRTILGIDMGGDSRVPGGSSITLDNQIGAPTLGPNPFQDYPTIPIAFPSDPAQLHTGRKGLAVKSMTEMYALTTNRAGDTSLVVFNPTTGAFIERVPFTGAPTDASIVSVTYSRATGKILTLGQDTTGGLWRHRYWTYTTGSLTYDHQWTVTELGTDPAPLPATAALQFVDEFITVVRTRPDGKLDLHQYDNGAHVSSVVSADVFNLGDIQAAAKLGAVVLVTGATNIIADGIIMGGDYEGEPVIPVINLAFVGAPGDTIGWLAVGNGDLAAAGIAALDTDSNLRTFYLARTGNLIQHSNPFRTDDQCIQVAWFDPVTGHESAPSAPAFVKKRPGSRLTFTIGPPPPGSAIICVKFFMGSGSTYPGNAAMFLQATSADNTYSVQVFDVAITGPNPTATPYTFTGSSSLKAADGTVQIADDKTGEIYDLIAAGGGGGSGGIGGVGGGHWGDTYGAMGVGGGHWGDTYG